MVVIMNNLAIMCGSEKEFFFFPFLFPFSFDAASNDEIFLNLSNGSPPATRKRKIIRQIGIAKDAE